MATSQVSFRQKISDVSDQLNNICTSIQRGNDNSSIIEMFNSFVTHVEQDHGAVFEHAVYYNLWRIKKEPIGDREYGRNCFHDIGELCSSAQEKVDAIRIVYLQIKAYLTHPNLLSDLRRVSSLYQDTKPDDAKALFIQITDNAECRVIRDLCCYNLWKLQGKPEGCPTFGEDCFMDKIPTKTSKKVKAIGLLFKSDAVVAYLEGSSAGVSRMSALPADFASKNDSVPIQIKSTFLDNKTIAKDLWKDQESIVSNETITKVNKAQFYLNIGFMLEGIEADGNCFFNAFLKSYESLQRRIPLLDQQQDKVSFLREQVAAQYTNSPSNAKYPNRAQEIKRNAEWVVALGEGDLLAKVLSIPIRLLTAGTDDVNDTLTFPEPNRESQEWDTLSEEDKPSEYIFIVDLGGHFVFASPSAVDEGNLVHADEIQKSVLSEQKSTPSTNILEKQSFMSSNPKKFDEMEGTFSKNYFERIKKESLGVQLCSLFLLPFFLPITIPLDMTVIVLNNAAQNNGNKEKNQPQ